MNQAEWEELNPAEQYDHLMMQPKEIKQQAGIDGKSKVGEAKVTVYYQVVIGKVYLNEWSSDLATALTEAGESLAAFKANRDEYIKSNEVAS